MYAKVGTGAEMRRDFKYGLSHWMRAMHLVPALALDDADQRRRAEAAPALLGPVGQVHQGGEAVVGDGHRHRHLVLVVLRRRIQPDAVRFGAIRLDALVVLGIQRREEPARW